MNTAQNCRSVLARLGALLVVAACKRRTTPVQPSEQPEPPG